MTLKLPGLSTILGRGGGEKITPAFHGEIDDQKNEDLDDYVKNPIEFSERNRAIISGESNISLGSLVDDIQSLDKELREQDIPQQYLRGSGGEVFQYLLDGFTTDGNDEGLPEVTLDKSVLLDYFQKLRALQDSLQKKGQDLFSQSELDIADIVYRMITRMQIEESAQHSEERVQQIWQSALEIQATLQSLGVYSWLEHERGGTEPYIVIDSADGMIALKVTDDAPEKQKWIVQNNGTNTDSSGRRSFSISAFGSGQFKQVVGI